MSSLCDTCGAVQPADWQPGDRCTACGQTARRELRCFWCTEWVPAGPFCRRCGAATVSSRLYGAARMLKAAGVDQLSLVDRLNQLPVEQRDHFTSAYQRQAALVSLHVDDAAFAESFLARRGWANRLDDTLTARLPVSEEELRSLAHRGPGVGASDDRQRLGELADSSPLPEVRTLASLALVRRGWADEMARQLAGDALVGDDVALAQAAALAFGHWRPRHLGITAPQAQPSRLAEVLAGCTDGEALLARAALGEPVELPPVVRASTDPDVAFAVALVEGRLASLDAALADPERRDAAAIALARHGLPDPLARCLADLPEAVLAEVVDHLDRLKRPLPALHDALLDVARATEGRLRLRVARLVALEQRPADAAVLLALDPSDASLAQLVLQRMALPRPDLRAVARQLIEWGRFGEHQYGVADVAAGDVLGDDFIPAIWPAVTDESRRTDLLRVAERQLGARGDDDLHRFVLAVAFGAGPVAVRSEAWWVLRRWYGSLSYGSSGPLVLEATAIQRWWGSVAAFLDRLSAFLSRPDESGDLTLQEKVAELLRYTTTANLAGLAVEEAAFKRLVASASDAVVNDAVPLLLRSSAVNFLELAAGLDGWREPVLAVLDRHGARPSQPAAFDAAEAARRIRERLGSS